MKVLKRNVNGVMLFFYLFLVISVRLFVLCDGQVTLPFVLSQLLVLTVLIVICPFLQQKIGCLKIQIRDKTDRKQAISWGLIFFVVSFGILYVWYRAYYPGAFSSDLIGQYQQALSGEYSNWAPILQTWITFTLPFKLTGKAASIVLFQIVEYSAVIAYMSYTLFKYGGRSAAVSAFLYVVLNPVTGNMAVCPWSDTTFAMFAILLMTFGLQIHITNGKWLDSKAALLLLVLVLVVAAFVNHRGILFTLPFLFAVLLRMDGKKKVRFLLLFILGMDMMRSCLYLVNPEGAKIWIYEAEQIKFPVSVEELRMTDMVYAIDGDVDWGIVPEMAENDLGLEFQESGCRKIIQDYTEYSRSSILRYFFWSVGIINLVIIMAGLCTCRFGKREDWERILLTLPVLCYSFGTMLLLTRGDFQFFYMIFPVCPIILMILFGQRMREVVEETKEAKEAAASQMEAEEDETAKNRKQIILAVLYTLTLFGLNYVRIFNINFWSDEGYSIMLSKMSFLEMIDATAGDVHPPLYYILLQIISRAMGFRWVSYRLLSLIPYGILLIFAMTVIWKKFGRETALIWITFSSLLNTAIEYNVQTRMYSWGALFVVMSFYCLHEILNYNRVRNYIGFVVMSLCAAYTQYYCLISVAFFYLVLILVAAVKRKEYLKKVLIACAVTVVAYLPWFFVLLKTFGRTSEGYWMTEIPSVKECLLYLFSSKCQIFFLAVFVIATAVFVAHETGILKKESSWKGKFPFSIKVADFHISKSAVWMVAGLVSVLGTIFIGIIVSQIFRPMFTTRYVYPVSLVAWLMLGIGLKKYKKKAVYAAVIIVLVVEGGLPYYVADCSRLKYQEDGLKAVLEATAGEIAADDVILTNEYLFSWTDIQTYYPEVESQLIEADRLESLDPDKDYWMFMGTAIDSVMMQKLEEQGYEAVSYVEEGNLGRIPVYVYRLDRAH